MTDKRRHRRTHLFTVRLWLENMGSDSAEVRGRVQHVLSGEVYYFRTWRELAVVFNGMLQEHEESRPLLSDIQ